MGVLTRSGLRSGFLCAIVLGFALVIDAAVAASEIGEGSLASCPLVEESLTSAGIQPSVAKRIVAAIEADVSEETIVDGAFGIIGDAFLYARGSVSFSTVLYYVGSFIVVVAGVILLGIAVSSAPLVGMGASLYAFVFYLAAKFVGAKGGGDESYVVLGSLFLLLSLVMVGLAGHAFTIGHYSFGSFRFDVFSDVAPMGVPTIFVGMVYLVETGSGLIAAYLSIVLWVQMFSLVEHFSWRRWNEVCIFAGVVELAGGLVMEVVAPNTVAPSFFYFFGLLSLWIAVMAYTNDYDSFKGTLDVLLNFAAVVFGSKLLLNRAVMRMFGLFGLFGVHREIFYYNRYARGDLVWFPIQLGVGFVGVFVAWLVRSEVCLLAVLIHLSCSSVFLHSFSYYHFTYGENVVRRWYRYRTFSAICAAIQLAVVRAVAVIPWFDRSVALGPIRVPLPGLTAVVCTGVAASNLLHYAWSMDAENGPRVHKLILAASVPVALAGVFVGAPELVVFAACMLAFAANSFSLYKDKSMAMLFLSAAAACAGVTLAAFAVAWRPETMGLAAFITSAISAGVLGFSTLERFPFKNKSFRKFFAAAHTVCLMVGLAVGSTCVSLVAGASLLALAALYCVENRDTYMFPAIVIAVGGVVLAVSKLTPTEPVSGPFAVAVVGGIVAAMAFGVHTYVNSVGASEFDEVEVPASLTPVADIVSASVSYPTDTEDHGIVLSVLCRRLPEDFSLDGALTWGYADSNEFWNSMTALVPAGILSLFKMAMYPISLSPNYLEYEHDGTMLTLRVHLGTGRNETQRVSWQTLRNALTQLVGRGDYTFSFRIVYKARGGGTGNLCAFQVKPSQLLEDGVIVDRTQQ